jgi:transcriptional regulator
MYIPTEFQCNDERIVNIIVENFPLALMIIPGCEGAYPVPLLKDGKHLFGHLSNRNPILMKMKESSSINTVFCGPSAYISPQWYEDSSKSVPTWNYCIVDFKCRVRLLPERSDILSVINRQVKKHDSKWNVSELSPALLEEMLSEITAFELDILTVTNKVKMSQNRSDTDKKRLMSILKTDQIGMSAGDLMNQLYQL